MMYVLSLVYSWPFVIGAICGLTVYRTYCRQRVAWENKYRPLPNGRKRYVDQIGRVWLAGLMTVLSLGWVLLTAQQTHDQTVALARSVARCWSESYRQTKAQIDINAQNDGISRQQQGLQREYDRATSAWIASLLDPPGELADEDVNSPARKAWGLQATAQYEATIDDLGHQFDGLVNQRVELDAERVQHPLPEPTCGK